MADCECVPAPAQAVLSADEILIYGIRLDIQPPLAGPDNEAHLNIELNRYLLVRPGLIGAAPPLPPGQVLQIVLVYGYAYEGHCYRLDKPKIMAFDSTVAAPAIGCGFEFPHFPAASIPAGWYQMWRLKANKRAAELNFSVDTLEKLILEANLPGKRAPNTYSAQAQLAHRGGRLTGYGPGV